MADEHNTEVEQTAEMELLVVYCPPKEEADEQGN